MIAIRRVRGNVESVVGVRSMVQQALVTAAAIALGSCSLINAVSGDCGSEDEEVCDFCNESDPCFTSNAAGDMGCGEVLECLRANPMQCGAEFAALLGCWRGDSGNCLPGPSCMAQIDAYTGCQSDLNLDERCLFP